MCRLLIFRRQTTAKLLSQSGTQIAEPWYSIISIVSLTCPYNVAFSFRNMQHPSFSHSSSIYRRCRFWPKEDMPFQGCERKQTRDTYPFILPQIPILIIRRRQVGSRRTDRQRRLGVEVLSQPPSACLSVSFQFTSLPQTHLYNLVQLRVILILLQRAARGGRGRSPLGI